MMMMMDIYIYSLCKNEEKLKSYDDWFKAQKSWVEIFLKLSVVQSAVFMFQLIECSELIE